jgi:hypothetical protein
MKAGGMRDASGRIVGFPILRDNGEEYAGKSMEYNFTTGILLRVCHQTNRRNNGLHRKWVFYYM